jgi:hypothetical protein
MVSENDQQTTEVNKDTLKMKADRTGKREFQEIKKKKRHCNCENLNTPSHAKIPTTILKNPYYTPCNKAHIITPPCNKDQVITPPGDMNCYISNL